MSTDSQTTALTASPRIILGVGVICIGLLLLLNHIPLLHDSRVIDFLLDLWPLTLVLMGVAKIRQSPSGRSGGGTSLVVIGLFILLLTLGNGHFGELLFPAILVTGGVFIVTNSLRRQRQVPEGLSSSEDYPQGTAILSAYKYRVLSQAFRGAELTAIFGGFELDLRQAAIEGGTARVDLFLLFGGGQIRVPEGWDVEVQAMAIAAGIENKAASLPLEGTERPKLVVTGTLLFGGTEIKR